MTESRSPWVKLRRNPAVIVSAGILFVAALAAIFGPSLLPASAGEVTRNSFLAPFQTSISSEPTSMGATCSTGFCSAPGFRSWSASLELWSVLRSESSTGWSQATSAVKADSIMMRLVDTLYAIPRLIFLLVLISALDPLLRHAMATHGLQGLIGYSKIFILILCLGLTEWLTMARIIRGQILSLKSQQFVLAARSIGQSHLNIIFQHLLPNLVGLALVYLTLTVPAVILDESFLSFLGVGVQAPLASWGLLLSDAAQVINPIKGYWWLLVFPVIAMSLTLLALNFLGDGLRDALDPRQRK